MDLILKYFPDLDQDQIEKFERLGELYADWNEKINVISRKDMDNFYERHVLHSLAIAKIARFNPSSKILDVGTGGGFPGIPLAIMFPDSKFTLMDSIGKKIKVVNGIIQALELSNAQGIHENVKNHHKKYDYVVSRAVTNFNDFLKMVKKNINVGMNGSVSNGILYLKGGDLDDELKDHRHMTSIYNLYPTFSEEFFSTKKVVHFPV
jgi:16S rRNA (guanine527-N7)-methyltransferase